jgi:hypothetical protein
MGLKDILKQHNIPIPNDFDERLDVIISGLKKKPDFHDKLRNPRLLHLRLFLIQRTTLDLVCVGF